MGLLTYAYPAARARPRARHRALPRVPRAADARARARRRAPGCAAAISPNERLQQLFHPWTSYVIVPLFALANAGIAIDGDVPRRARSPRRSRSASWSATWSASRSASSARPGWSRALSRGRLRPPVGWAAVAGGGTIAGIGFTVVAADRDARVRRRRSSRRRSSASSARRSCASLLTWLRVPRHRAAAAAAARSRALLGTAEPLVDLDVDRRPGARPHPRARSTRRSRSSSTATSSARTAGRPSRSSASCSRDFGDVALRLAAPAAERRPPARAARRRGGRGGRRAGRVLGDARPAARPPGRAATAATCVGYAEQLGLDVDRFRDDLREHAGAGADRRGRRQRRPQRRLRHARRSSSTAAATTAPTTSTRCPPPSARPARARRCAPRTETTLGDGVSAVDPITPDVLIPQPHELVRGTGRRTRSPGGRRWPTVC